MTILDTDTANSLKFVCRLDFFSIISAGLGLREGALGEEDCTRLHGRAEMLKNGERKAG